MRPHRKHDPGDYALKLVYLIDRANYQSQYANLETLESEIERQSLPYENVVATIAFPLLGTPRITSLSMLLATLSEGVFLAFHEYSESIMSAETPLFDIFWSFL